MMEKRLPREGFEHLKAIVTNVWIQGKFKEAEELLLLFEEYAENFNDIQLMLDEARFYIARDAFGKGQFNEAETALSLCKGDYHQVTNLKNQVSAAKTSQNYLAGTSRNTEARAHSAKTMMPHTEAEVKVALDEIMEDPPVVIPPLDPEEEYKQKVQYMILNSIMMRYCVLGMEAKLANCNMREGTLDRFNPNKISEYDDIMMNVDIQFQKCGASLQTFNLEDAHMYLKEAEVIFLELCPEELRKKKNTNKDNNLKSGNNILSEVKPLNYQPKERDDLTVKGDNIDVMKCLRVAEKAMAIGDFDKAEKFLNKAERILPTQAAKKLLEQIRIVKEARLVAEKEATERQAKANQEAAERKARSEQEAAQRQARAEQEAAQRKARVEQEAAQRKARAEKEATEKKAKDQEAAQAKAAQGTPSPYETNVEIAEEVGEIQHDVGWKNDIDNRQPNKKGTHVRQSPTVKINIESQPLKESTSIDNQPVKKSEKTDSLPLQDSQEEGKKRRAGNCLAQAQEAFSNGDLHAANKLAKKAHDMYPSAETRDFLTKIDPEPNCVVPEVNENTNPNAAKKSNKQEAGKIAQGFVKNAMECVCLGHLDESEKLLQKARKSDPNVDIKEVEASLRAARASRSSTDGTVAPKSEDLSKDPKSRADKDFMINHGIATNAMGAKDYVKAEKFLKIAYDIKPTKNVEELLKQVQIELFSKETKNTSAEGKKTEENDNSFVFNMAKAKQLYRNARKALSDNKFDEAEALAMQSLKLNPLNTTKELLNKINSNRPKIMKQQPLESIVERPPAPIVTGDQPDKIDQKFKLFREVEYFLDKGNPDEAEKFLMQSESYGECKQTEDLRNKIQKLKKSQKSTSAGPQINYGSNTCSHQRQVARQCMEMAETAIKENDLEKAEHLFNKSYRMFPDEQVKARLQQVQSAIQNNKDKTSEQTVKECVTANETESSEENLEVDKCIEVATKALSSEEVEKALKFLQKAQRIQPTTKAQELLEDIQHIIQQKEENEAEAEKLVASAMEAIGKEDFDFAEMLLTNARIKYKSDLAKQLLADLLSQTDTVEFEEGKRKSFLGFGRKRNPKETVEKQKVSAEEYYTLAHTFVQEGKLEDAETILIIAQNTYPSKSANKLLGNIRDKIYSRDARQLIKTEYEWGFAKEAKKQGIVNRDAYKSNSYVQMAQRAFFTGNNKLAEEFLQEADKLCPCTETKHLLTQVRNGVAFVKAPPAKKKK